MGSRGPPGAGDGAAHAAAEQIVSTLAALAQSGELWLHASATLIRILGGFAIGAAAGTVLGALTGSSDLARRLLDPMLQALRAVPSIAWVPLFILWLGILRGVETRPYRARRVLPDLSRRRGRRSKR